MICPKAVLAVVPARGGSKSIPNKNLIKFHDISITGYALHSANKNRFITHVCLSSDSTKILNEINIFSKDFNVGIRRPTEISKDDSDDQSVLIHATEAMEDIFKVQFEVIVMLQPTSPIRSQKDIDNCIQNIINLGATSSWTMSKVPTKFHFQKQFIIEHGNLKIATEHGHIPRRQDLDTSYHRDGGCYAISRETLYLDKLLMGSKCLPVISSIKTNDIDFYEDIEYLESSTLLINNELKWQESNE